MSFLQLSPLAFALGLAALAGVLFALQRLRVRHREVVVPTLLFWREALEEAPARVLTERFRHPLAYLLALAIGALLWFAFAGPVADTRADARRYELLIDGSAVMQAEGRLAAAIEAAREQAARLPEDRRRVVWCGSEPRTVLLPGEPAGLLDERLRDAAAEASPSSLDRVLATLARTDVERTVLVFGDSAIGHTPLDVVRPELDAKARAANRGVVGLGVEPSRSGRADAVDLRVVLSDTSADVDVALDGASQAPSGSTDEAGTRQLLFRDLPARGGLVTAELAGADSVAFDDRAARRLPVLAPLRVALEPGLPAAFGAVVEADPRLVASTGTADVAIRVTPEFLPELPGIELTRRGTGAPITIRHAGADTDRAEGDLAALVGELALDRLDATALATALDVPLTVELVPGGPRRIGLWAELFDLEATDLVASRAFPVLVSRGLRWAAATDAPPLELAAGRPLSAPLELARADGSAIAGFGAPAVPRLAGDAIAGDGRTHPIALAAALPVEVGTEASGALERAFGSWITWGALAALALLLVEWWAVRSGRMP